MTRYEVICGASGDRAEADDLAAALAAALTLVDDYLNARGTQGATRVARRSLIIARNGQYDGLATTMAQDGQRPPDYSTKETR